MDLGSIAVIALIAGLTGGAVGAALVGTVEGMLRQRQVARRSVTYPNRAVFRSTRTYQAMDQPHGDAPFNDFNDLAKRVLAFAQDERGICLCRDTDVVERYRQKYASATRGS